MRLEPQIAQVGQGRASRFRAAGRRSKSSSRSADTNDGARRIRQNPPAPPTAAQAAVGAVLRAIPPLPPPPPFERPRLCPSAGLTKFGLKRLQIGSIVFGAKIIGRASVSWADTGRPGERRSGRIGRTRRSCAAAAKRALRSRPHDELGRKKAGRRHRADLSTGRRRQRANQAPTNQAPPSAKPAPPPPPLIFINLTHSLRISISFVPNQHTPSAGAQASWRARKLACCHPLVALGNARL